MFTSEKKVFIYLTDIIHFPLCIFPQSQAVVLGGSEDGNVYVWDVKTGVLLDRLRGHRGVIFHVDWSNVQALAATASHDGTIKTWWQDTAKSDDDLKKSIV